MSLFFDLKSRRKRIDLIPDYLKLRLIKLFKVRLNNTSTNQKEELSKIDILIPTATKDFQLLDLTIASLKNLNHPINKIFIVAPANEFINKFCREHEKCILVEEQSVLGYDKRAINYKVKGMDRSGWIFQQLLKLSGDKFVEQENYFVIDADTILVRKINLIDKGKFIFFQNLEWHQPYFLTFKKLFGYPTVNRLSFTSHMMIFNQTILRQMKKELEQKYEQSWDQVYLSMIDQEEASCISDYDTYANWVLIHQPELALPQPLYNKGLPRNKINSLVELEKKYHKNYQTISFHNYIES